MEAWERSASEPRSRDVRFVLAPRLHNVRSAACSALLAALVAACGSGAPLSSRPPEVSAPLGPSSGAGGPHSLPRP